MPGKLTFKGDKDKAKDKERQRQRQKTEKRVQEAADESVEGWVEAESLTDLVGPCCLLQTLDQDVRIVALRKEVKGLDDLDQGLVRVHAVVLEPPLIATDDGGTYSGGHHLAEPDRVEQVWRLGRLMAPGLHVSGQPVLSNRFTLKSSAERFLACDRSGQVDASREARGPLEEWVLEPQDGTTWTLKSTHGTYLALDDNDGEKGCQVRGDSKEVGPRERFIIKVQAEARKKARLAAAEPEAQLVMQGTKRGPETLSSLDDNKIKRDKYCW